jgi:hypothetical protein
MTLLGNRIEDVLTVIFDNINVFRILQFTVKTQLYCRLIQQGVNKACIKSYDTSL